MFVFAAALAASVTRSQLISLFVQGAATELLFTFLQRLFAPPSRLLHLQQETKRAAMIVGFINDFRSFIHRLSNVRK